MQVFLGTGSGNANDASVKYQQILLDFRYLKAAEAYDEKIDSDADAVDLDEEFRENHMQLLERFYTLFDSIYKYIENFCSYIHDMHKGAFLQHTVEGVLMDPEGKQLMCEALYLYGCMLLLMDMRIPGPARERMIVAYYRYKGAALLTNIDAVCRLCRDSGFSMNGKRPANYPEDMFSRIPIDRELIDMVLGRLRSDDIYNHTSAFPAPAHRSVALATQSSMLYVCLYFAPDLLHNNAAVCREVVDKAFADNWMITMYMGYVVDLFDAWAPYKAASTALRTTLSRDVTMTFLAQHTQAVGTLNTELDQLLTQGVLTEEYVMDNQRKLVQHVRNCNVTLRWFILHRSTGQLKLREAIRGAVSTQEVLRLLMNTSQFEFILKTTVNDILNTKFERWETLRKSASEYMQELSDVFGGTNSLRRVKKNDNLKTWFAQIATQINEIEYKNSVVAGRTLAQLIHAVDDVQSYHQIEASLQVKQALIEVKGLLTGMVRLANITPKLLADLDVVTEFAYAKKLVTAYTPLIHEQIARDPSLCLLLRATFLKLSSLLSLPLVRITQAGSKDDISVAEYYSTDLVNYVRGVLEIVPISVFRILDRITQINTHKLKPLPAKLERKYLKDSAQLVERYALAKLTYNVSVFTRGILNMHTTLLGIIKLDPRQTLQDGVRKQLVQQISSAMNEQLTFTGKIEDFETRLLTLGKKLDGFRQSVEYIQDYINTYGLKIWQEEVSRIINYNVEQESNAFLKTKVYDWQSAYQSDAIPIPVHEPPKDPVQARFVNFTGRMVNELLRHTSPQLTTYVPFRQGWYSIVDGKELIGLRTYALVRQGLGVFGLCGLDKLISFTIVRDISAFCKVYRKLMANKGVSTFLYKLSQELHPTTQFPLDAAKLYSASLAKMEKVWPVFLEYVSKVGQAQIHRRHLTNELNFACRMDSKVLASALEALNTGIITDLKAHYENPEEKAYPENPVMPELTKYLDAAGMTDPVTKIYVMGEPLPAFPVVMFLFVLAHVTKFKWSPELSTLVNTDKKLSLDGWPFVMGVVTLLKQFHSAHTHTFLNYLGQFVRANVSTNTNVGSKNPSLPVDVVKVLLFLEEFCKIANIARKNIDAIVPSYLFDCFQKA